MFTKTDYDENIIIIIMKKLNTQEMISFIMINNKIKILSKSQKVFIYLNMKILRLFYYTKL